MKEIELKLKILTNLLNIGFRKKDMESEFIQRLALSYFADGNLSFGQAAKIVAMTVWEFADLLYRKKIIYDYDLEELEKEIDLGKELGLI